MSGGVVDYYCTMSSPWTFLGHAPFLEMAARHRARIAWKPVDFRAVFRVSGGLPMPERPVQRRAYRLVELQRWSRQRGVAMQIQPRHFPTDPTSANLMVLAAARDDLEPGRLAQAIMQALWVDDRDIADVNVLEEIARKAGLDATHLTGAIQQPETRTAYEALTDEAKARMVFGAPTYIHRGEMFWGQDRLEFLERALAGETDPIPSPRIT